MKPGDTFRIGGIPIVVVSDYGIPTGTGCVVCAFSGPCTDAASPHKGPTAVNNIEKWKDGCCWGAKAHYEVRL